MSMQPFSGVHLDSKLISGQHRHVRSIHMGNTHEFFTIKNQYVKLWYCLRRIHLKHVGVYYQNTDVSQRKKLY